MIGINKYNTTLKPGALPLKQPSHKGSNFSRKTCPHRVSKTCMISPHIDPQIRGFKIASRTNNRQKGLIRDCVARIHKFIYSPM